MEGPRKANRPGLLPVLSFAFAAGVWLAAGCASFSTSLFVTLFPMVGIALLAVRRGHRVVACIALVGAFLGAGMVRGASIPVPPAEGGFEAGSEARFEAGHGPAGVPWGLAGGPGNGPGPPIWPPSSRICADALSRNGLPPPGPRYPASLEIEGQVVGTPSFHQGFGVAVIQVDRARQELNGAHPGETAGWLPVTGLSIQLGLPDPLRPLPGDRVRAAVTLDDAGIDLPGSRERRDRMIRSGISCLARIERGRMAVVADSAGPSALVEEIRRLLLFRLRSRLEPGPAAALVAALAVGDREAIEPDQRDRFATSGLAHILSVSGLHLGVTVLGLYRLVEALLSRLPLAARVDPRRVAAFLALPAAPAYAALTGASPPVLRAAIGASLFLLATALYRAPDGWSALGAAALVLLAWSPILLFDPSFQLSFAACVGLLAIAPGLRAGLPLQAPPPGASAPRRWVEAPIAALVTTAAATLATLPFLAVHFEEVSLASLPANVAAGPVAIVATVSAAIASVVGLLAPPLLPPILFITVIFCAILDHLAAWFASMPGAAVQLSAPSMWEIGWLLALAFFSALSGTRRKLALAGLLTTALALWWCRLPPSPDGNLHVLFLPVGQGDCTLLVLPDGTAILVDAGGEVRGEVDVAGRRVLPQLRKWGVRSLHAVAVSHLHPDHVGGVPGVLDKLPVEEVWTSGRPLEGRFGAPLAEAIRRNGVHHRVLARGHAPIEVGGVVIEILGPPDLDGMADDPLLGANDASLVLRVVHGDIAILLAGDVEAEGEAALLDSDQPLQAALVKAPHHGSRTSSTQAFLEEVKPEHVVFCVGHRNQFGFPHDEVVERYRKAGCSLHRTDRGPIHFLSDGVRIERAAP